MREELIFRDSQGVEYSPVRQRNRQTGEMMFRVKPPGASNETDDCLEFDTIEELAKAMLVDGLPARVGPLAGGQPNYLKFGAQKLKAYELSPRIAEKIGVDATSDRPISQADKIRQFVIKNYVVPAREAEQATIELVSGDVHDAMGLENSLPAICSALEGKKLALQANIELVDRQSPIGSDKPSSTIKYEFRLQPSQNIFIDRAALGQLKKRFLEKFPDFEEQGAFPSQSSYHLEEDDYKRSTLAEAQLMLGANLGSIPLGTKILDLLLNEKPSLIGYYKTIDGFKAIREAHSDTLERAVGELANSDETPPEAAETFLETAWPLLVEGTENNKPYGDSRILATVIQALTRPKTAISVMTRKYQNLGQALLGRPFFGNNPLSADEYRSVLQLAGQLLAIMRDEWGWKPRDLWDVQGFIWVTCDQKLEDGDEMTDEELLARFDSDKGFRSRRIEWSDEQTASFCQIARAVHTAGFDWYPTNIPALRFGRRELTAHKAAATAGQVILARSSIRFSNSSDGLGLDGEFRFEQDGALEFSKALDEAQPLINEWQVSSKNRKGHWPDEYSEEAKEMNEQSGAEAIEEPTNLILYGPPGTGKTYRTAAEAVRLCGKEVPQKRDDLMDLYRSLTRKGRIGFVTFHQNFSYEDFVEGLRPQQSESDGQGDRDSAGFSLVPRDGVFKEIAKVARENRGSALTNDLPPFDGSRKIFKMSLGRSWASEDDAIFEGARDGNYVVLGWGGDVDWSAPKYDDWEEIKRRWRQDYPEANGNDPNMSQIYTLRTNMEIGSLVVISDGNMKFRAIAEVMGEYQFKTGPGGEYNHRRKVRWLWHSDESLPRERIYRKQLSQVSTYQMQSRHVVWDALEQIVASGGDAVATSGKPEPYVLVIDEINRANVSKVFGELITLLEPDKRANMPNGLSVKLPYSGDDFSVPANLHIIGTMNTADRSIALLDTALRRRFKFEELAPDTTVGAFVRAENETGLPLATALETMNRRIEYLVDRDHRIGHAFFIGCKTKEQVDAVMRDKIIPLLQEYFFDDWNRLAAVLGEKDKGGNFLEYETIEDPMSEGGEALKSWRVKREFDLGAYERLIGKTKAAIDPLPEVDERG